MTRMILPVMISLLILSYQRDGCSQNKMPERIFVSTDRDEYFAGEVLWFSMWLNNPEKPGGLPASKISYIEILNSEDYPVNQSIVCLENGTGHGQFTLADTLSSGKYLIRAYTNLMKNFQDCCFYKDITVYNVSRRTQTIPGFIRGNSIEMRKMNLSFFNQDTFKTRQRVQVRITPGDSLLSKTLSVAVIPYTSNVNNILTSSESSDVLFREYVHDSKFRVENKSHFLYGSLLGEDNKPAPPGEIVLLSVPGKTPVFKYAKTDIEGRFGFNIKLNENIRELIIQPYDTSSDYHISMESPFSSVSSPQKPSASFESIAVPSYIGDLSVNYQAEKMYNHSALGSFRKEEDLMKPSRFYGKPATEIFLKDWTQLRNIEEIFFELIPGVSLKKEGGKYKIQMFSSSGKELFDTAPVIMIDGVIIWEPSIIAHLNPVEVEKIDVVKKQYLVGDFLFNGIVNVITKSGDFKNIPLPGRSVRMKYSLFDPVFEFKSPEYNSPERIKSHEPDFRNTLYWNPLIRPESNGDINFEFYTSDLQGDYIIIIQGVASDGIPFSAMKRICVK